MIVVWGEGHSELEQALRAPRPWCGRCPLLSSPPPVSAPARLCGAAVGGRGERDHLRPEPLRWEGERRERGEGPARCLLLRATAAGAPTSSRQPLLQLRVIAAPPLLFLTRLCGQGSAVGDSPAWRHAGRSGFGSGSCWGLQGRGGRDLVSLSAAGSAALRRPLPPHPFGVTGKQSSGPLPMLSKAALSSPLVPQLPRPRPPGVWPTATATVVAAAAAATRRVLPPHLPARGVG